MRISEITGILLIVISWNIYSADDISVDEINANVNLPTFNAKISVGFNYDWLRTPTDVSFEYPKGFFGFNIPIEKSFNLRDLATYIDPAIDSVFTDSTIFSNGESFRPNGVAKQNANFTIRVDVPMLWGVATFSNVQNFYLNYQNALGNPNIFINPDSLMDNLCLIMRGTINVPIDLKTSWETMTLGYAYKLNRNFIFALNINRHIFNLDLRSRADIDILGKIKYETGSSDDGSTAPGIAINQTLDYPSKDFYGRAYGHYEAECWTPTLGMKAWRFTLTSRFGFKTKAKGKFYASYSLPFFVDPETFEMKYDFENADLFNDPEFRQNLTHNVADSIAYTSKDENGNEPGMVWEMPTGLTLDYEIIPNVLSVSYTKLFGDINLRIDRIVKEVNRIGSDNGSESDTITIDMGVSVDHIMLIHFNLYRAFMNIGVFGMDFRYDDDENLLGSNMPYMHLGSMAMLPILDFGASVGGKLQVLAELNVLPLPAFKTGVSYYF